MSIVGVIGGYTESLDYIAHMVGARYEANLTV